MGRASACQSERSSDALRHSPPDAAEWYLQRRERFVSSSVPGSGCGSVGLRRRAAGRFQSRRASDSVRQLLRLPRARRQAPHGEPAPRYRGGPVRRPRQLPHRVARRPGEEPPAGAHQRRYAGQSHAAPAGRHHAHRSADRHRAQMDRAGRQVGASLGVRAAAAARDACRPQ